MRRRHLAGTTLVEVLVVIVVFLVGILALVQVFPPGLTVLTTTKNNTMANNLARAEIDRLQALSAQAPELIAPVSYQYIDNALRFVVDPNRSIRDLMPPTDGNGVGHLGLDGTITANSTTVGDWMRVSGANVVSRVIGEHHTIGRSAAIGEFQGCVVNLTFGPIAYYQDTNSNVGSPGVLLVYGNDFLQRIGDRSANLPDPNRSATDTQYYFVSSQDTASGDPFSSDDQIWVGPGVARNYRIAFSFYYNQNGTVAQYDTITQVSLDPNNPPAYAQVDGNYWVISVNKLVGATDSYGRTLYSTANYAGVVVESLRMERVFDEVPRATAFDVTNPYQYKVISSATGQLLLNSLDAQIYVRGVNGTRVPLKATADYTVQDWRIIREDIRVPQNPPNNWKLILNSIKFKGRPGPDGRGFTGMGLAVPGAPASTSTAPATIDPQFVLTDVEDGGFVVGDDPTSPCNSYTVDKRLGVLQFNDVDNDSSNGLSAWYAYRTSDPSNPWVLSFKADIRGRHLRALYMARDEWSVQMYKAANSYRVASWPSSSGLQVAECYVGGSVNNVGNTARIYFPIFDAGQKVTIGEVWYRNASGLQLLQDQEYQIDGIENVAGVSLAYTDVSVRLGAGAFDYSNGYAVRRVQGASMKVRVLWNPAAFTLGSDDQDNFSKLEVWMRSWRRMETESFMIGGQN